ncbi:hypothetical protein C0Q70_02884 [Pomacea canaliculata]|uniref:CUB domain-containing protein n=1 Tax=Pomacea canaliculata TaxID=400727 RepID=A0A2T7PR71_POMCA|nr:hypothetical protein C0Q70_02884 [Pomacea canaliculata]
MSLRHHSLTALTEGKGGGVRKPMANLWFLLLLHLTGVSVTTARVYSYSPTQRFCQNSTPPDLRDVYRILFNSSLNASAGFGFQANVSMVLATCGSVTNASAGDIDLSTYSSDYINGYHRNGICVWSIEVEEDEIIQLLITELHIETETRCNEYARTYLAIYDGSQTDGSLLVRLCSADVLPSYNPVTSTTRRLVVVLTLDEDFGFTRAAFAARYKSFNESAILRDCGGDISGEEGVVSSPNYPANYDNLRVCEWRITVEEFFNIRVDIHDLDIESLFNESFCDGDSLLITGAYPSGQVYRLCGRHVNKYGLVIYSASNNLTMRFVSDWENNGRGFNASWRKACEWPLKTSSGWIQSLRFPATYLDNLSCSYFIGERTYQPGISYIFTFETFDLQEPDSNGSCIYDYLEILQVPSYNPGYFVPPEAKKASLEICASNNPKGAVKVYLSEKKVSSQVLITQEYFLYSFDPDNGQECRWWSEASLDIYDRLSTGSAWIGTYCGYASPQPITSTSNELSLSFGSSYHAYATGFNATYTTGISQILSGTISLIKIGRWTKRIFKNGDAKPTTEPATAETEPATAAAESVTADNPSVEEQLSLAKEENKGISPSVTLSAQRHHLAGSNGPVGSLVLLCDGNLRHPGDHMSVYGYSPIQRFCQNSTPPDLTGVRGILFYSSLNSSAGFGFQANVSMVFATCGSVTNASAGDIYFSAYPSHSINGYQRNAICVWTIEAEEDEVIQLLITELYIQSEIPGCNDLARSYLEIYDGSQTDNSLLVRACSAYELPGYNPVTSTTRRLVVVLTLDEELGFTQAYFTARYKSFNESAFLRDCGGDISGDQGVVSSPNYPANYDNLRVCEWRITLEDSFTIRIDIHDLDIRPSNYGCHGDSLLITGAYPTGQIHRLCGSINGLVIYSASNNLTMRFVSDWENNGRGFNASWRKACELSLQTSSGWIQSLRFPATYLDNLSCSYFIGTNTYQPGISYTFTFETFDLQEPDSNGSCIYDYLEILQVPSYNPGYFVPPEAKKVCGKGPTENLRTYFPTTLHFVTDGNITKGGFNISFLSTMAGCGESLLVGEKGFITSPNYPGIFPQFLRCTTTIRVQPGHKIILIFTSFFLSENLQPDNGQECWRRTEAFLDIYESLSTGSAWIGTLLQINKIFPELFIRSRRVRVYDDREDNSICFLSDDTWTGSNCRYIEQEDGGREDNTLSPSIGNGPRLKTLRTLRPLMNEGAGPLSVELDLDTTAALS